MNDTPTPIQSCPVCGHPMYGIRGAKAAICRVCGFKDGCC